MCISTIDCPLFGSQPRQWLLNIYYDIVNLDQRGVTGKCLSVIKRHSDPQREVLEAWFSGLEGPQALFARRILPFNDRAGLICARLMADVKIAGRSRNGLDMIVASVAETNGCVVVTDNEKNFAGLQFINPLRGAV